MVQDQRSKGMYAACRPQPLPSPRLGTGPRKATRAADGKGCSRSGKKEHSGMWRGAALSTSKLETFQGMALGRALRSKGTDKFPREHRVQLGLDGESKHRMGWQSRRGLGQGLAWLG